MASKEDVKFVSDIDNKLKSACPNVQLKEVINITLYLVM